MPILALVANVLGAQNLPRFLYSYGQTPFNRVGITAIATDAAANTYITGTAPPRAIATTPGALQPQSQNSGTCGVINPLPCNGSFVVKLDAAGSVVFATYLPGNGATASYALAVDRGGNVYVGGTTSAPNGGTNTFPVTPGAAFTSGFGFVLKLNPSGNQLVYSTLIPSSVQALAIDAAGNVYITGAVDSKSPFPTTAGAFQVSAKASNPLPGIVAKLNASGSALLYGTYLSGSGSNGNDHLNSIAVDAAGNAFVAGSTYSTDFPVTAGAFLTKSPAALSVFVTKLNPQGSGLVYSTYLGQTQGSPVSVKLDAQGTAFVAGSTDPSMATFPTTPGAIQSAGGTLAGFLTHLSSDGSILLYSTYLPNGVAGANALDVDPAGDAVVAAGAAPGSSGNNAYANLPTGVGAFQPGYGGGTADGYVARFTANGQLVGATYLGGSQFDGAGPIAWSPDGSVVVGGETESADFPGIAQPVPQGGLLYATNLFISLTAQNAASYAATAIAPGEIITLRGYGIGPATGAVASGAAWPTQLGGVQVSIGGYAAPLVYAQSQQINAQVPWELGGQTSAMVQVSYTGLASSGTPVAVAPAQPGVFFIENSDYSFNSPSNPARAGDYVSVYGTGGGAMSPSGVTGAAWPLTPLSSLLTQPVLVKIGGEAGDVLYSGSAPTVESGLFQINVRLPADLTASANFLSVSIGGVASAPVPISIR